MILRRLIWASAVAGLLTSGPAAAQPTRPSPGVFRSGGCDGAACTHDRWIGFLKVHGEAELATAPGVQLRLTVFNAEVCGTGKDTVDIRRYQLGASPKETRIACGTRTAPGLSADRAALLAKLMTDPDVAKTSGEFPVYCSDADDGRTVEVHVLEILEGDRYRLIEWDCEPPGELKPLASFFNGEPLP